MKQCEPLKEPLNAQEECAPWPPGLWNRRHMVFILREQYDKLDPTVIREKQEEAHCILVPVERDEMDRIRQEYEKPIVYVPKLPEILWQEPSPYYGGANIGKGYKHIEDRQGPKDYAKKKKAKHRQQKQSRRRNK